MTITDTLRRLGRAVSRTRSEEGQALVEYSLLISLIAVVAFVAVETFGQGVSTLLQHVVDVFP